jgi:hypothetical protein
MPLDYRALYCAVEITGDLNAYGEKGIIGTGFVVTVEGDDPDAPHRYLITADHVIATQHRPVEVKTASPNTGELGASVPVADWSAPLPDVDLAVAPFNEMTQGVTISLERQVIKDRDVLRKQEIFPGSPIHYIGVFTPVGRVMARSGTIGALDVRGLEQTDDVTGKEYDYPAHLLDCRSYTGFSGSPCFVELSYAELKPTAPPLPLPANVEALADLQHASLLCGMLTMYVRDELEAKRREPASRYGVAMMLRSDEIWEALMTDELRKKRKERDDERAAAKSSEPSFKAAGARSEPDEFSRFEDLARKLVNVPKKDADEQRGKK